MAWNTPGGDSPSNNNKGDKDPWTGKPKPAGGPPDLEQIIRKYYAALMQLLSKKKVSNAGGPSEPASPINGIGLTGVWIIVGLIVAAWVLWGIYIVGPGKQGVVLRFGKYVGTVLPGPHWIPPLIDSVYIVNQDLISRYPYDAEMLTKDENIVSVAVAVQYRVDDAKAYLFGVVHPEESLKQATASALRQVIGQTNLTQILTSGREQVRQQVQDQITKILARYSTGLLITDVALQSAKAPDEVKEAFDDAIKAQEDEQRYENQAQTYAMQVEPIAKGQAQRLLADARGYQQQVVLQAQAEVSPFVALLPAYKKDPQVMRERMYLETLEKVLSGTSKVLMDNKGNNMFYLPLDKMLSGGGENENPVTVPVPAAAANLNPVTTPANTPGLTRPDGTNTTQGGY